MLLVCSQERRWLAARESDRHRVRDASAEAGGMVRARSCSHALSLTWPNGISRSREKPCFSNFHTISPPKESGRKDKAMPVHEQPDLWFSLNETAIIDGMIADRDSEHWYICGDFVRCYLGKQFPNLPLLMKEEVIQPTFRSLRREKIELTKGRAKQTENTLMKRL